MLARIDVTIGLTSHGVGGGICVWVDDGMKHASYDEINELCTVQVGGGEG